MTTRVQIQIKDGGGIVWKKSFSIDYGNINKLIEQLNDIRA